VSWLLQLAGWALVGVGLWIHVFQESLLIGVLLKDNPTAPMLVIDRVPVALVGCGAVITVIGFLGCCGACTESVCFLGFVSIFQRRICKKNSILNFKNVNKRKKQDKNLKTFANFE